MKCPCVQFYAVCVFKADNISCILNDGKLHTEAESEVWDVICAGILDRQKHTVDAAVPKAARDQNSVDACQQSRHIFPGNSFRIDPFDIDRCMIRDPAVLERFHDADVSVVQSGIFAD